MASDKLPKVFFDEAEKEYLYAVDSDGVKYKLNINPERIAIKRDDAGNVELHVVYCTTKKKGPFD